MEFTNSQQIKGGDVAELDSYLPLPLSYQAGNKGADDSFRAADANKTDKTFSSITPSTAAAAADPYADDDAFEAAAKDITDAAVAMKDGLSHIISSTIHKAQDVGHALKEKLVGSRSPSPAPHHDDGGNTDEVTEWPARSVEKTEEKKADEKAEESNADELLLDGKEEAKEKLSPAATTSDSNDQKADTKETTEAALQDWERGSDLGPAPSTIKDFETKVEQKKEKFEKEWPPLASPEPEQPAVAPAAWEEEEQQQQQDLQLSPRPTGAWAPENATIGGLRHAPAPVAWQNAAKAPMHM